MKVLRGWECDIIYDGGIETIYPGKDIICKYPDSNIRYIATVSIELPIICYNQYDSTITVYRESKDGNKAENVEVSFSDIVINPEDTIHEFQLKYRRIYKLLSDDNKILKIGDFCYLKDISHFRRLCIIKDIHYNTNGHSTIDLQIRHDKNESIINVLLPTDEYLIISYRF